MVLLLAFCACVSVVGTSVISYRRRSLEVRQAAQLRAAVARMVGE
jgi:hypothetical protein